jgi:hypothetical protein
MLGAATRDTLQEIEGLGFQTVWCAETVKGREASPAPR